MGGVLFLNRDDMKDPVVNFILERLRSLPPERFAEVEDFYKFLMSREGARCDDAAGQVVENRGQLDAIKMQPPPPPGGWTG